MTLATATPTYSLPAPATQAHTLVIMPRGLQDARILQKGIKPGTIAVSLGSDRPLLEQITMLLQRHRHVTRLVLVTQGEPGIIHWGETPVTTETLLAEQTTLKSWLVEKIVLCSDRISADAGFVKAWAKATGSHVIASAEALGHGRLPELTNVFTTAAWQSYQNTVNA